jgi:large subunit ribosomal protein L31
VKAGIHPKYVDATVTCACGNTWTTRSTRAQLRTDVCSKCHPFYTGEQRIVDTAGRVERFMQRMQRAQTGTTPTQRPAAPPPTPVRAAKPAPPAQPPATLETLLDENPAPTE